MTNIISLTKYQYILLSSALYVLLFNLIAKLKFTDQKEHSTSKFYSNISTINYLLFYRYFDHNVDFVS